MREARERGVIFDLGHGQVGAGGASKVLGRCWGGVGGEWGFRNNPMGMSNGLRPQSKCTAGSELQI